MTYIFISTCAFNMPLTYFNESDILTKLISSITKIFLIMEVKVPHVDVIASKLLAN